MGLHQGFYARDQIVDLPVYENYGEARTRGDVPYRDFRVEYPPAALPVFVLPALGDGDSDAYRRRFEGLMAAFGAVLVACVALALAALGAGLGRAAAVVAFVALSPLLLGSVMLSRFDLWPAVLVAGALAAVVSGRLRLGSGLLGLAVAAKLWPAVLVPLVVAYVWRLRGRREAVASAAILVGVVFLCFPPFLALAPVDVLDSVWRQARRPLQIESLGSALLLAGHHVFGLDLTMKSSSGSQNLQGVCPMRSPSSRDWSRPPSSIALWVSFARGPATRERLVRYAAATVVAFIALGKVLSPQFLIWLLPLVPLVRGRRGVVASALLAAALVLTQLWFPYRYWDLALEFDEAASWLVLARDVVLIALLVVLVEPKRADRDPRSHRSTSRVRGQLTTVMAERTGPGYATATRTASHELARPVAGSHSISAPSMRTSPSAGWKRIGIPVRMREMASSARRRSRSRAARSSRRRSWPRSRPAPRGVVRLDVRVRADHGRHATVEIARHGDLLARRLGVEVDEDHLRRRRGLLHQLVDELERARGDLQKERAHQVHDRDRLAAARRDHDEAAPRRVPRHVGRSRDPLGARQPLDELPPTPGVVAECDRVGARTEKLLGETGSQPDAVSGVFPVYDAEIDVELLAQRAQPLLDRAAPRRAKHVRDEEDFQDDSVPRDELRRPRGCPRRLCSGREPGARHRRDRAVCRP